MLALLDLIANFATQAAQSILSSELLSQVLAGIYFMCTERESQSLELLHVINLELLCWVDWNHVFDTPNNTVYVDTSADHLFQAASTAKQLKFR